MFHSSEVFLAPFFEADTIYAEPYTPFAKDLFIGLSDPNAKIAVRQRPKENVFISPPDHSFVLDVTVKEVANTEWITLERELDGKDFFPGARLTALVALRSSSSADFNLQLRLRKKSGGFHDLPMGSITPEQGDTFNSQTLSVGLGDAFDALADDFESAVLILFVPVEEGLRLSLSMLNVLITPDGMVK